MTDFPVVGSVHASHLHAFSKSNMSSINLIENLGVEGDAHSGVHDKHRYHVKRYGQQLNLRQVHLIQAEFLQQLALKGHSVQPGDLGENICTRNVDLLSLPTSTRLLLGKCATIELTSLRNPCPQIENFQTGLLKHCVERNLGNIVRKVGVMAIVLKGGIVQPGDEIVITLPETPHKPLLYRKPIIQG